MIIKLIRSNIEGLRVESNYKCARLDYQLLFGNEPMLTPENGWTREPGIVNCDQWETCLLESSRQHKLHKLFSGRKAEPEGAAEIEPINVHF